VLLTRKRDLSPRKNFEGCVAKQKGVVANVVLRLPFLKMRHVPLEEFQQARQVVFASPLVKFMAWKFPKSVDVVVRSLHRETLDHESQYFMEPQIYVACL